MEGLIFSKHNLRGRAERRRHCYWTVNVIVVDCRGLPAERRTLLADICRRTGKKLDYRQFSAISSRPRRLKGRDLAAATNF
jgi:hypothetical protein